MRFPTGPLDEAENQLRQRFSDLARLWLGVKETWKDERARQFEEEHLHPLEPGLNRLSAALSEFRDVIGSADRKLADDEPTGDRLD